MHESFSPIFILHISHAGRPLGESAVSEIVFIQLPSSLTEPGTEQGSNGKLSIVTSHPRAEDSPKGNTEEALSQPEADPGRLPGRGDSRADSYRMGKPGE